MRNCKNVECTNLLEEKDKRVYCSLKCRNVYVNKYLRDYSKYSNTSEKKRIKKKNEYELNPKKCLKCSKEINFESRRSKFCSHSCCASFTNPLKGPRSKETKKKISIKILNHIKIFGYCGGNKKTRERFKKQCGECSTVFETALLNKRFCSKRCGAIFSNRTRSNKYGRILSEKEAYKLSCKFKFALNSYPDYFDFDLIRKFGWYKAKNHGDNLNGVSRDHLYSINEGFKNKVAPEIISHPANCGLKRHSENSSKNIKCEISLEKLLEKIKEFDKKYRTMV